MSLIICSPDGRPPHRKRGVLKEFFSPVINSKAFQWFKDTALLEYPHEYLDVLQREAINHHYGNWDEIYSSVGSEKPAYDLWLQKYDCVIKESRDAAIIDLGCGYGNDTLYLHERGYKVISCDLSLEALKRLSHFIDKPVVRHFDMLAGLPFDDDSAKVIIADLSIHYFPWKETERIVEEIFRVLAEDGYLLCRVNSISDNNHGAGQGRLLEDHYYEVGGRKKRFFDRYRLEELFRDWKINYMDEYSLSRFGSDKILWEIAVQKGKSCKEKKADITSSEDFGAEVSLQGAMEGLRQRARTLQ